MAIAIAALAAGTARSGRLPQPISLELSQNFDTEAMLAAHNRVREQVGVSELQWSSDLAEYAQEWADELASRGFEMEHRPQNQYGENLAWASGRNLTAEDVVEMWASERADYNYEANSCSNVCGHYTQIVWDTTEQVGCGTASNGRQEIWVCNYNPPGNYVGERPY
jgi:uncharacterized protein YkwD